MFLVYNVYGNLFYCKKHW